MSVATAALGEIAKIERVSIAPEDITDGTLYVGLENVVNDGTFAGVVAVSTGDLASNKFRFTKKHILFGKLRPYLKKIAAPNFTGICSTDILPILPGPKIDRRYLYHFLRTPEIIELSTARSSGANLPRLSPGVLAEFQVPLPGIEQQRRVAAVLDEADSLRQKRRLALQKLATLIGSILVSLLRNCPDLNIKSLADISNDMHQGINTVTEKIDYQSKGYPIIQSKHTTRGYLDLSDARFVSDKTFAKFQQKYRPAKNDVLLCNIGTIGKSLLVEEQMDFLIAWNLFLIKLDEEQVLPSFCKYYFDYLADRHYFDRFLTGGTVKFISKKTLSATPIPLPPVPAQREFSRQVKAVEKLKAAHLASLAALDTLFASLESRGFRGQL